METGLFDTERFIHEIELRPAIWDSECADYRKKALKRRNWNELVDIFCDPGNSLEKKVLCTELMKKWKYIRDNYTKECKKQKRLLPGSRSAPRYVYHRNLQFLHKSREDEDIKTNFVNELPHNSFQDKQGPDISEIVSSAEGTFLNGDTHDAILIRDTSEGQNKGLRKKLKATVANEQIVEILQTILSEKQQEHDEDRLFCLSLFGELKKVPAGRRLKAKIDILNTIQRAQST